MVIIKQKMLCSKDRVDHPQRYHGMGSKSAWILLECDINCTWINEKIRENGQNGQKKEEMKNFASNFSLTSFSHFYQ